MLGYPVPVMNIELRVDLGRFVSYISRRLVFVVKKNCPAFIEKKSFSLERVSNRNNVLQFVQPCEPECQRARGYQPQRKRTGQLQRQSF